MKSELISIRPDARVKSNGCHGTLEREEWRPVKGYEGKYEVSSFGRVKSIDRTIKQSDNSTRFFEGKILKQRPNKYGYPTVKLSGPVDKNITKRLFLVHRLVMDAFVPNPDNLPMVNHRNEVKTSNYPDNMEWCDAKYNANWGTGISRRAQSQRSEVLQINPKNGEIVNRYEGVNSVKSDGFNPPSIVRCCNLKYNTHKGWFWRYAEDYNINEILETTKLICTTNPKVVLKCDKTTGEVLKEYQSLHDCNRDGFDYRGVSGCCHRRCKTYKGFIWKFKK